MWGGESRYFGEKFVARLLKCSECGKYSLEVKCACGGETRQSHPPKYSPEDKYARYRRSEKYGSGPA